jgi:hypothetical protein
MVTLSQALIVYPEFEPFEKWDHWPLHGFVYVILKSTSDQYKERSGTRKPATAEAKLARAQAMSKVTARRKNPVSNGGDNTNSDDNGNNGNNTNSGDAQRGNSGDNSGNRGNHDATDTVVRGFGNMSIEYPKGMHKLYYIPRPAYIHVFT